MSFKRYVHHRCNRNLKQGRLRERYFKIQVQRVYQRSRNKMDLKCLVFWRENWEFSVRCSHPPHDVNKPFPSLCWPPLQSESKCEVLVMVI